MKGCGPRRTSERQHETGAETGLTLNFGGVHAEKRDISTTIVPLSIATDNQAVSLALLEFVVTIKRPIISSLLLLS